MAAAVVNNNNVHDRDDIARELHLSTSTSLFDYLYRLDIVTLKSIYALPPPRGPLVAVSVLRSSHLISDLAKQFVLRLVTCGGSFSARGIVHGWVSSVSASSSSKNKGVRRNDGWAALEQLEAMGIIESNLGLSTKCKDTSPDGVKNNNNNDRIIDTVEQQHVRKKTKMMTAMTKESEENGAAAIEGKYAKLLTMDVTLTVEFCTSMKIYLSTSSSTPWPIITLDQIDSYNSNKRTTTSTSTNIVGSGDAVGEGGGGVEKPSRNPPTYNELESYTQSSWDSVLHFLVGSDDVDDRSSNSNEGNNDSNTIDEPSDAMIQFLTRIGLMQEDPDYIVGTNRSSRGDAAAAPPLVITSKGYEFMLLDINAQVWQFVLQYMNSLSSLHASSRDAIRIEAISFLICLGSTRVGDGYHISVLGKSKEARQVMKDFGRFGLVFVCRVAGKVAFYPTRVAVNLIASNEKGITGMFESEQSVAVTRSLEEALAAPVPSRLHLAVVVQTNFQVVAYTRSKLHISTIGLFCDVQSYRRLPNVIFFHLSRDSVRGAFRLGITADQILRFLHVHAHPMLRLEGRALVPSNVRDQILLWDRERRRVVMDEVRVVCVFLVFYRISSIISNSHTITQCFCCCCCRCVRISVGMLLNSLPLVDTQRI
jgi:transcription initiation factor TFIIH subunit 4